MLSQSPSFFLYLSPVAVGFPLSPSRPLGGKDHPRRTAHYSDISASTSPSLSLFPVPRNYIKAFSSLRRRACSMSRDEEFEENWNTPLVEKIEHTLYPQVL